LEYFTLLLAKIGIMLKMVRHYKFYNNNIKYEYLVCITKKKILIQL
jgi:hypothetical protein